MVLAVASAALVGTAAMATATPDAGPSAPVAGGTASPRAQLATMGAARHYAVPEPNCPAPAPGHRSCLSDRLVKVAAGTPGAKAYAAPTYSRGPDGGFTPSDLASAYGYTPSAAVGASQTVAIVDAYDDSSARSELDTFDRHYGLPAETATSFRKVDQKGHASPLPALNTGWAQEIALDIQAVRGVCHRCHILLVEADSTSDSDLAAAVDTAARMGATEISNSYGSPETYRGRTTSSAATLAAYNHPGIVITASTGDDGWYDWDLANDGPSGWSDDAPNAPASYPSVVGVGGTALSLNSDGSRAKEVVWNENGPDDRVGLTTRGFRGDQGASGGGCSSLYDAPSYQASMPNYSLLGCAPGKRSTADVAALADPYTGYDIYSDYAGKTPGWVTAGGTSLSSPLIAAMWALAGGSGGVSYPAKNLYAHLSQDPSSVYDVEAGGNAFCDGDAAQSCSAHLGAVTQSWATPTTNPNDLVNGNSFYPGGWAGRLDCGYQRDGTLLTTNLQCDAAGGFDGPSGVGTPAGLSMFRPWGPTVSVSWPSFIRRHVAATFRTSDFADPQAGAEPATYRWSWGDGATTSTTSATATHTFAGQGRDTVSVRVVDTLGQSSQPVTRTYTIGYPPAVRASGPRSVIEGRRATYAATVSEPNTGGRITGYTWRIGRRVLGHGARLSHRFTARGSFRVRVSVHDNSGLSARSNTVTVTVR